MRDCKLIRESLSGWLDGQLSASDAEIIRLHLESCAPCDGERRQLEKLQVLAEESFSVQCTADRVRAFLDWGPRTDYKKAELA